jgi:uncharacterized phosphosugar-binding protein
MALCVCGCGEATAGGLFKSGHDQKMRSDIERRAGGLVPLKLLIGSAEEFANGRMDLDTFAGLVRKQFSA